MSMTKQQLINHIKTEYDVEPAFLWKRDPECFAIRHKRTNKWFGVAMTIEKRKLGIDAEGVVDIVDVKAEPEFITMLVGQVKGLYPGYHMNKTHWLTICLDGTASDEQIEQLIRTSFTLTDK